MPSTTHRILTTDARDLSALADASVDQVVTSPPYPMIAMWDAIFAGLNADIGTSLHDLDGWRAFELMHVELDRVWRECARVLRPGCFACVNIGDATRSIGDRFRLYPNHSRIISAFIALGFDTMPTILWRKQTNAPNKFMGSGMLPAGAYVTLEHEYILIFRKAGKRAFVSPSDKMRRNESAFFWEERNCWFSDVWDFKGATQGLDARTRERSGAFPFELPYRLVNMYSLKGDTVLDPFAGTGTTMHAAMACGRNGLAVEIDAALAGHLRDATAGVAERINSRTERRLSDHRAFVATRSEGGKPPGYGSVHHGFPVMTRQEVEMRLEWVTSVARGESGEFVVEYEEVATESAGVPVAPRVAPTAGQQLSMGQ
jgi:DNA modification methylase